MKRKKIGQLQLTPGELELLEILWAQGPVTIAEAHQAFLARGRTHSYPTTQTRLNRLVEKDLVRRVGQYPAKYETLVGQEEVSGRYFDLFETLCGGDIAPLMLHLAQKRDFRPSELDVLKEIISRQETRDS